MTSRTSHRWRHQGVSSWKEQGRRKGESGSGPRQFDVYTGAEPFFSPPSVPDRDIGMSIGQKVDRHNFALSSGKMDGIAIVIITCRQNHIGENRQREYTMHMPLMSICAYQYWYQHRIHGAIGASESRLLQQPCRGM